MAANDVTITAANVRPSASTLPRLLQAGGGITAGQVCYLDASAGKWLAANTTANAEESGSEGLIVALTNASLDNYFIGADAGIVTIGGTVAAGETYVLSDTSGAITLASDATTGWRQVIIGYGASTSTIELDIRYTGYTQA